MVGVNNLKNLNYERPNKIHRLKGSAAIQNLIASISDPKANLDE